MASTTERTYSFRAAGDLGDRLVAARRRFTELVDRGPDVDAWLSRELEMALARELRHAPEASRDQSTFMRTAVELLVSVTEKVSRGLELESAYAEAWQEDHEADAFARAASTRAASSWDE